MGERVPFPWVTGLPHQAQRELESNFLALQTQISTTATGFDALVLPGLTADIPSSRFFVTPYSAINYLVNTLGHTTMRVGVLPATTTAGTTTITETVSLSFPSGNPESIQIIGLGWNNNWKANYSQVDNRAGQIAWDINTKTTPAGTYTLYIENLTVSAVGRGQIGNANTWFGNSADSSVRVIARHAAFLADTRTVSGFANLGSLKLAEHCWFRSAFVGGSQGTGDLILHDCTIEMLRSFAGVITWQVGKSSNLGKWELYDCAIRTGKTNPADRDRIEFMGQEGFIFDGITAGEDGYLSAGGSDTGVVLAIRGSSAPELVYVRTRGGIGWASESGQNAGGIILDLDISTLTQAFVYGPLQGLRATTALGLGSRLVLDVDVYGASVNAGENFIISGFNQVVGRITHRTTAAANAITLQDCSVNLAYHCAVVGDAAYIPLNLVNVDGGVLVATFRNETGGAVSLMTPYAIDAASSNGVAIVEQEGVPAGTNSSATWIVIDHNGAPPAPHTHPSTDITDFAEAVDDRVAALLVAGNDISLVYDDVANTLTVAVSGLTAADISDFNEAAQDAVLGAVVDSATIDFTYDDVSDSWTAIVKAGSIGISHLDFDPATQAELDAHINDTSAAHAASAVSVVTTSFNKNLSSADDTVQKALDTLDDLEASGGGLDTGEMLATAMLLGGM